MIYWRVGQSNHWNITDRLTRWRLVVDCPSLLTTSNYKLHPHNSPRMYFTPVTSPLIRAGKIRICANQDYHKSHFVLRFIRITADQWKFFYSDPVTNGVYIERWDRIDYKRVRFLLADERYPNLPSLTLCLPTYQQPQRWTDFFGARVHAYFSPLQTGNHYFYLCECNIKFSYMRPRKWSNSLK